MVTVGQESDIAATDAPPRRNPYVGLVPFGPDDVDWFFGRDREQRIIGANLRSSRLTLLYGASGVGKSSVLLAAVVPKLREVVAGDRAAAAEPEEPGPREPVRFAVSVFSSWRDSPLRGWMEVVADSVEEATGEPVRRWTPGTPVRETFAEWLGPVSSLLIVLDQFEEYFLYHPHDDGPGTFAGEFVEVVNDARLRVNFLISLREDGLAKLDRFKGRVPRLFENYLRVGHLELDQATRAIEGPIEEYNRRLPEGAPPATIDDGLVRRILEEVRTRDAALDGPGASTQDSARALPAQAFVETPLLQLVMQRLWAAETEDGGAPKLTLATLTDKLGGTEKIIHRHLEEALDRLPDAQRDLAAAVLRPLISPSGTKIAWRASDIAFWAKHPAQEIEPILQALASGEQRILRTITPPPTEADQSPLYELFHDILAQPVLEWCGVREGEGQERERRRERRNRVVRGVALGLAALTVCLIAAVAVAINSRDIAGSRALAASATTQLPVDPERGLLLATAAMEHRDTVEATQALRRSLAASRVRARLDKDGRARPCRACGSLARPAPRAVGAVAERLAIAPDGRAVAGIVGDRLRLWNPRSGAASAPALRIGGPIGVAFTADARRLLVVGQTGAVLMAPDGSDVTRLPAAGYGSGATAPTGPYVVTVGDNGARIWDARSGKQESRLLEPRYLSAAFGTGRQLMVEHADGALELWDWRAKTLRTINRAGPHLDPGFPARFSAGAAFATQFETARSRVSVVAANGRSTRLPTVTPEVPVQVAAISPDATRVVVERNEREAELWGSQQAWRGPARRIGRLAHADGLEAFGFSPDSRLVGTASSDGTARVWDGATGDLVAELRGHIAAVTDLAFSADGRFVATAGEDLTIRLWDLGHERTLRGDHPVEAVVTGRSGSRVAVVEFGGELKVWDARAGRERILHPFGRRARASVSPRRVAGRTVRSGVDRGGGGRLHPTSAALAADDRSLLVGYGSSDDKRGAAVLLDIASGSILRRLVTGRGGVLKVAVAHRARSAAIVRAVNAARVVELFGAQGRLQRRLRDLDLPTDVAFSRDGTRLLVTTVYGGVFIYDARSRGRVTLADGSRKRPGVEAFYRGVFSPDGKTVAVAGSRDVRLWDSATTDERDVLLSGHTSTLRSVAYSRDSRRIVTASSDGTVRVWDAKEGTTMAVISRHAGGVNAAAFLEDRSIVSGGMDGAVRTYRCETCGRPDALLGLARNRVTRDLTSREHAEFGQ